MALHSTGSSALQLDDNQSRWLTVGIAMNKVLVPHLRSFAEGVTEDLYQQVLLHVSPPINHQNYNDYHKKWGKGADGKDVKLEYKNINGNDQVTVRPAGQHYDYNVTSHGDLAKLFFQHHMAKFATFAEADMSAVLGIIVNVDDSACPSPQFTSQVKTDAQDVREKRNAWAHCHFPQWDQTTFSDAFSAMETLLKHAVPAPDQPSVLAQLDDIKQNGHHLVKDHSVQMDVLRSLSVDVAMLAAAVQEGKQRSDVLADTLERLQELHRGWAGIVATELVNLTLTTTLQEEEINQLKSAFARLNLDLDDIKVRLQPGSNEITEADIGKYCQELNTYHEKTIQSLLLSRPQLYDVKKYVRLKLCAENIIFSDGSVLDEYSLASKGIEEILLEDLFQATPSKKLGAKSSEQSPRTVVLVGVPGGGKTITCHYLLKRVIEKEIFQTFCRFAFFIKCRDLNVYKPVSFQSLLLSHHGPSIKELKLDKESLWTYLVDHQDELMILVDGYDELDGLGAKFNKENTITYNEMDQAERPQVLLYNLIRGNILQGSKVILTTRPHCVEGLRDCVPSMRLVSLGALNRRDIEDMIRKDLGGFPVLCEDAIKFVRENSTLQRLCSVPINVKSFLDNVRWVHRDHGQLKDTHLVEDKMPKSLAGLVFVMDIKMIQVSDRIVQQKRPDKILEERRDFIQRISRLAFSGLRDAHQQMFTEEDIENVGLTSADLEGSILTCSEITVEGDFGPETRRFYSFPHFTNQEHLAGLYLTQRPFEEVEELVRQNDYNNETLLPMYLGASGDDMVNKYLSSIFPHVQPQDLVTNARRIVERIWQLDRRVMYMTHTDMYAIRMWYHSRQWDMAPGLAQQLCNQYGVLRLPTPKTPTDCAALSQFIHSMPTTPRFGFTGVEMDTGEYNMMPAIQMLVREHPTLTSLQLRSDSEDAWSEFSQGDYSQLRGVRLMTHLQLPKHGSHVMPASLIKPCQYLDTLAVDNSLASDIDMFATLPALKHLRIASNFPRQIDVRGLCKVVLQSRLTWLHLENIYIDDKQAAALVDCLSKKDCRLKTLRLQACTMSVTGYKAVCEAAAHNKCLTALGLLTFDLGEVLVAATSDLLRQNTTIKELDIHFNEITDISDLCDVLQVRDSLCVLDLSDNKLSPTSKQRLCAVLEVITSLEVLILKNTGFDDESVDELKASLDKNTFLKALSLRWNKAITMQRVEGLINSTHVEVLDVSECDEPGPLKDAPGASYAQALCSNSSIKVLGFGSFYKPSMSTSFLDKLVESYPLSGPLQALYLPCELPSVRRAGADLAEKLHVPHLVRHKAAEDDIVADTGYRWYSLPLHEHWPLLHLGTF